jgi:hypothetical protein
MRRSFFFVVAVRLDRVMLPQSVRHTCGLTRLDSCPAHVVCPRPSCGYDRWCVWPSPVIDRWLARTPEAEPRNLDWGTETISSFKRVDPLAIINERPGGFRGRWTLERCLPEGAAVVENGNRRTTSRLRLSVACIDPMSCDAGGMTPGESSPRATM